MNRPTGALRLYALRAEVEDLIKTDPDCRNSDHPRADVVFLIQVLELMESTFDQIVKVNREAMEAARQNLPPESPGQG